MQSAEDLCTSQVDGRTFMSQIPTTCSAFTAPPPPLVSLPPVPEGPEGKASPLNSPAHNSPACTRLNQHSASMHGACMSSTGLNTATCILRHRHGRLESVFVGVDPMIFFQSIKGEESAKWSSLSSNLTFNLTLILSP